MITSRQLNVVDCGPKLRDLNTFRRRWRVIFDHLWSGVIRNFGRSVCLSVCCQTITFESLSVVSSYLHVRYTGQVRTWRSSRQGQGHRSKKVDNPYSRNVKTSIGNNSGSIQHTAKKFADSRGSYATVDRMVWPPSLSLDQKWPRVTKYSRVVGLRLDGNLVSDSYRPAAALLWRFCDSGAIYICHDLLT